MRWLVFRFRRLYPCAAMALALLSASPVHAVQPDEVLPNTTQETRARALSRELRCMVCQNQSIDDSDAPLARDLRLLVRERIVAGDDDKAVMDFLVARYGEFVLLKPRLESRTLLLWLVPPLLLLAGGIGLYLGARRRRAASDSHADGSEVTPLSADETARLAKLTDGRL